MSSIEQAVLSQFFAALEGKKEIGDDLLSELRKSLNDDRLPTAESLVAIISRRRSDQVT